MSGPLPQSSSSSSSLSLSPETPSVVINEPPDETLVQWLKDCRVDQDSVETVRSCLICFGFLLVVFYIIK